MSLLPILEWPDPRLAQACAPVAEVTPGLRALAADMLETMYAAPGRGLAGPQVGAMLRIFVMDVTWKEGRPDPQVILNPVIEPLGDAVCTRAEGCLSIPGILTDITRPARVRMRWSDLEGVAHEAVLEDFAAACVQHETDHLDGVVTLMRLAPEARARSEAEYRG
ncbi:MAG: peptide deformylase [Phaeovulum sp.]|uniref:peptide deformylase n=1 Tax=Phaeovulum sp. TaxID=2934796 RepID=UPI002730FFF5|nr:peptide deformylase [Phaeovulum sp.]MDP2063546.1 peptide deformylase [Phaeovulum sp.]